MDYAERIRHLARLSEDDLKKYKKMFSPLVSESGQNVFRFLIEKKLEGEPFVWRQDVLDYMWDTYKYRQSRVAHNLLQMVQAGICEIKAVGKRDKYYGLSDGFSNISSAMILLSENLDKVTLLKND